MSNNKALSDTLYTYNNHSPNRYLDMAFNTDIVPVGNFMYILEKVSYTKIGGPISWTFMVNNYATILLRLAPPHTTWHMNYEL